MIHCKKNIIAACFFLAVPFTVWAEAPVVDDSENFATIGGAQAHAAPGAKNDNSWARGNELSMNDQDDGPALAKEDTSASANNSEANLNDSAKLIEKVQNLQQEVQELRGQLEVQAHDLKLLQQQQLAFYKDLDARLGTSAPKSAAAAKASAPFDLDVKPTVAPKVAAKNFEPAKLVVATKAVAPVKPSIPVSRANPADEQISYLAAYELVKNKQYDAAIIAMQTFASKYPQGGYTANAEYWLGELYMVKKDYSRAIEHFDIVLNQFPNSSKSAASMLKEAYAYSASGNQEEAINRLEQVIKNYPDTPTAQMAKSKLESIKAA